MEHVARLIVNSNSAVRNRNVTSARGVFMRETIPEID
jgi:hypothetical protein